MKTRKIAELLSAELIGDGDVDIDRVAELSKASASEIAFSDNYGSASESNAACLIVPMSVDPLAGRTIIRVPDPKLAFALVAEKLHPPKDRYPEIHPTAIVADSAILAEEVFVGAFVCVGEYSTIGRGTQLRASSKVGDNVIVGDNCVFDPGVFVEDNCTIGNNVILHSGVVIGTDGFGFV